MIGRVTQQGLQRHALENLQQNLSHMQRLQTQLSTGKLITKPSDDPAGTVDAMRLRSDQRATAQHARNAADGQGWLTTIETALGNSLALLRQARDLTVQGANTGAGSTSSREAIAIEIQATADALREQANTTYLGRSVFAGTSSASTEAFTVETDGGERTYSFHGTPDSSVERRISANTTVRVDSNGAEVFGTGGMTQVDANGDPVLDSDGNPIPNPNPSVFALLDHIAGVLREAPEPDGGNNVGDFLDDIDSRMDAMLGEVAAVGTRYNQISDALQTISTREVTLADQLSAVENADFAETVVELQMQEVAYNAALSATSRALQPSLLDFLR